MHMHFRVSHVNAHARSALSARLPPRRDQESDDGDTHGDPLSPLSPLSPTLSNFSTTSDRESPRSARGKVLLPASQPASLPIYIYIYIYI